MQWPNYEVSTLITKLCVKEYFKDGNLKYTSKQST